MKPLKKAWSKNYSKTVKAALKAAQKELKATNCESSEEEPETESEETVEESESETEEATTKPVKVSQTCDGSNMRLVNEQTANLFEIAKRTDGVYQDVSMPADNSSLWWDAAQARSIRKGWSTRKYIWKRAFEINTRSPGTLWGSKGILPAGVRQGGLGDCWWVAVASALAEYPDRIKKIFKNYDQAKGIYEMEMWSGGMPTKVVVDDRLPTINNNPQMARQSANGAWWLPILEKAAAKYWGTYERMHGGNGGEAYQQLTGYPQISRNNFRDKTEAEILEIVKTADDSHNVMWGGGNGAPSAVVGMVRAHLYSVIGHTNWNGMDFIQWRNPWGSSEFHGQWSDKDTTTDAKQLAAFRAHVKANEKHDVHSNDGKFWMVLADVKKYIGGIEVGLYLDDYKMSTMRHTIKKDTMLTTFVLKNPVKQHLVVQSDTVEIRQLMDRTTPCVGNKWKQHIQV